MSTRYRKTVTKPKPRRKGSKYTSAKPFIPKSTNMKSRQKNYCNSQLLSYSSLNHMILPPRMRTKFTATYTAYTGTGVGTGYYQFDIKLNSLYHPFNGTAPLTSVGFTAATNWPAVNVVAPIGFSNICNVNLYQRYRVYASEIAVNVVPSSISDQFLVCLTPSDNAGTPANAYAAQDQPRTKSFMFQPNRPTPTMKGLVNYCTVHDLAGTTRRAVEDDVSQQFGAAYNADPGYTFNWVFNGQLTDGSTLAQVLELNIQVTYYAELWFLGQANLLQT